MPATTSSPCAFSNNRRKFILPGDRVARKRHARAGIIAHVTKDHRANIDRRAEVVRNLVQAAIINRACVPSTNQTRL